MPARAHQPKPKTLTLLYEQFPDGTRQSIGGGAFLVPTLALAYAKWLRDKRHAEGKSLTFAMLQVPTSPAKSPIDRSSS